MIGATPGLSHLQKLTTAKPVKPGENSTQVNVDKPELNSSSKVTLYDRTKLDTKNNDFGEPTDGVDHGQLNIIATGLYNTYFEFFCQTSSTFNIKVKVIQTLFK